MEQDDAHHCKAEHRENPTHPQTRLATSTRPMDNPYEQIRRQARGDDTEQAEGSLGSGELGRLLEAGAMRRLERAIARQTELRVQQLRRDYDISESLQETRVFRVSEVLLDGTLSLRESGSALHSAGRSKCTHRPRMRRSSNGIRRRADGRKGARHPSSNAGLDQREAAGRKGRRHRGRRRALPLRGHELLTGMSFPCSNISPVCHGRRPIKRRTETLQVFGHGRILQHDRLHPVSLTRSLISSSAVANRRGTIPFRLDQRLIRMVPNELHTIDEVLHG